MDEKRFTKSVNFYLIQNLPAIQYIKLVDVINGQDGRWQMTGLSQSGLLQIM